jgi:hypothetical protein
MSFVIYSTTLSPRVTCKMDVCISTVGDTHYQLLFAPPLISSHHQQRAF